METQVSGWHPARKSSRKRRGWRRQSKGSCEDGARRGAVLGIQVRVEVAPALKTDLAPGTVVAHHLGMLGNVLGEVGL